MNIEEIKKELRKAKTFNDVTVIKKKRFDKMNAKKIGKRVTYDVIRLCKRWTTKFKDEEYPPLIFISNLAQYFFIEDVMRLLSKYYAIGRKHEKKIRKIKATKRFLRNKGE